MLLPNAPTRLVPKAVASSDTSALSKLRTPMVGEGYFDDAAAQKAAQAVEAEKAALPQATAPEPVQNVSQAPQAGVAPVPDNGAAQPTQSIGAAVTPTSQSTQAMTASEAEARRLNGQTKDLDSSHYDRVPSGVEPEPWIPGVQRTLGQMDLAHAAEEHSMRNLFPEEFKAQDKANNATIVEHIKSKVPDEIAVENLKQQREADRVADIAPMENSPQPVNLEPVKSLV